MRAVPCALIRGGTSRGAYFLAADLPDDPVERDALLVRIMGGPDALQVDGIGGGHPLTSKVAVIGPATRSPADVDYLFLQVDPARQTVSDAQNCGNLLAGVGVFAIEGGLVAAQSDETAVCVHMVNSGALCRLVVRTPGGRVQVSGNTAIDGVPGTGAPIVCNYLDIAGSSCGALLPTGNVLDEIDGVRATCIDNGMPVVVLRAADLQIEGTESPEALEANNPLREKLESIRLHAGPRMGLGDVAAKSVPKMCLVSAPRQGGLVATRTFIPHVCHRSIGVLGAVSVATACLLPESPAAGLAQIPGGDPKTLDVEHPSGSFQVRMRLGPDGSVVEAGVVRTARLLFLGEAMA